MHLISTLLIFVAQIGVITYGMPINDTSTAASLNPTFTNPVDAVKVPHQMRQQITGTDQYVTLTFGNFISDMRVAKQLLEEAQLETYELCQIFGRNARVTGNLYVRSRGSVYLHIEGHAGQILPYFSYQFLHNAVLGYWQVYVQGRMWWTSVADFTIEQRGLAPLSLANGIFNIFPGNASSYPQPLPTPVATS